MKFVTVTTAASEAEGLMFKEMLTQAGIKSMMALPTNQMFLRSNAGGASMPFNVWEIKVAEADLDEAKRILPEEPIAANHSLTVNSSARKFALFWLTSILLGLAVAIREMFNYFTN